MQKFLWRALILMFFYTSAVVRPAEAQTEIQPSAPSAEAPALNQTPTTDKSGIIDDNNKNSSSFVVDPDPLDPLPVKNENIKDGEEIVLDDIRQIIDQPAAPKKDEKKKDNQNAVGSSSSSTSNDEITASSTASSKKPSQTSKKPRKKKGSRKNLKNDDPDERIESRLHSEYLRYNINPTSVEQWSLATQNQKENVYIVQKYDNLYTISRTLFGDSKFWPKIWALNRSSILNPHQIVPGMKIYFYAGDNESAPTLSFNSTTGSDSASTTDNQVSTNKKEKLEDTDVQNTEYGTTKDFKKIRKKHIGDPTPIPDSLPMTQNARLFTDKKAQMQIDLKPIQYNEVTQYTNPYYLSSTDIKSDFVVPKEQIPNLICKENQFVPLVDKKNANVAPGKFVLITRLMSGANGLRDTYKYKLTGSVTINNENQMRVTNCRALMDIDTLIVSEEKMQALVEPNEKFDFSPRIVDGLDYQTQEYYADHQYLVVNINGLNVDNGADLNIYSESLGKNVGRLRILQRTGTMAIAVVTRTFDLINKGDKVTE